MNLDSWLRSKTMWFALALEVFGAVQLGLPEVVGQISAHVYPWLFIAVGVAVRLLRLVTTQPLASK
jgi:hypothetical protein